MNKSNLNKIKRRINKLHKTITMSSNQDEVLCGNQMGLNISDGREAISLINELMELVNG